MVVACSYTLRHSQLCSGRQCVATKVMKKCGSSSKKDKIKRDGNPLVFPSLPNMKGKVPRSRAGQRRPERSETHAQ
jgi:hypothetical protein